MAVANDKLILDPQNALVFYITEPFVHQIMHKLQIKNPDPEQAIFFKIKTSEPKLYCVRPTVGRLQPLQSVDVEIYLQPFEIRSSIKLHKFLVQATPAQPNVEDIFVFWKQKYLENIWDARLLSILHKRSKTNLNEPSNESGTGTDPVSVEKIIMDTNALVRTTIGDNLQNNINVIIANLGKDLLELRNKVQYLEKQIRELRGESNCLDLALVPVNPEEVACVRKRNRVVFMTTILSIVATVLSVSLTIYLL